MSALETQVAGGHYKTMTIQPIEFCHKNKLGPCESLAIKYIARHGLKGGRQDIEKAIHCLQLLLELEYPVKEPVVSKSPDEQYAQELLKTKDALDRLAKERAMPEYAPVYGGKNNGR